MKSASFHHRAEPIAPQRVVVIGGSGFIGKSLVQQLGKQNIVCLSVSSKEIDLTHPYSVENLGSILRTGDSLVFASAITPDKGKDITAFMKNLKMGEHLAAVLEPLHLNHFIYISSDAVFPEDIPPIDEMTLPAPNTLYGLMHLSREKMMAAVLEPKKVPYLILRPCAIYGPGDTHNSYGPNRFVRSAREEKKIKLFGQGEERRPHLHVDDFVSLIVNSLLHQSTGLLHAIPATSLSFQEVAQEVVKNAKGKIALEYLPRSGSPSHKHFIDSQLRRAFPDIRLRNFSDGISEMFLPE